MWKLWNKIFGWDYISWKNSADNGVARVNRDHNGVCYYFRYKTTKVVDRITDKDKVIWLTCKPEKYMSA